MPRIRLINQLESREILEYELSQSVIEEVEAHWDKKIREGIIPTEVRLKGNVDLDFHARVMDSFAEFEAQIVSELLQTKWKPADPMRPAQIHYFGIGTGAGLAKVTPIANQNGHQVVAYDTCSAGYTNGIDIFASLGSPLQNTVFMADMCFACQRRYIKPENSPKLIASRVLDILDSQEVNWKKKPRRKRKMARTARRIGRMPYVDALIIHPCPEDNPHAIWGDTTLHTLEEIVDYMREGHCRNLDVTRLGRHDFHGHIYTAALIQQNAV
jgi:hypothetical protein